ncbi:hypothetical protein PG996_003002 [Apiospora saccharicola]|uniref:C2H2-type domain-containing protein n=1 Tax=Apiospora saccharicola TaxID=335842 RepID=A0ABR1VZZ9_9PEZI
MLARKYYDCIYAKHIKQSSITSRAGSIITTRTNSHIIPISRCPTRSNKDGEDEDEATDSPVIHCKGCLVPWQNDQGLKAHRGETKTNSKPTCQCEYCTEDCKLTDKCLLYHTGLHHTEKFRRLCKYGDGFSHARKGQFDEHEEKRHYTCNHCRTGLVYCNDKTLLLLVRHAQESHPE